MRLHRRQFLSTCAAGAAYPYNAAAAAGNGSEQSPWPSTFPALRQLTHGHQLAYLDSAATTLRPQSVIDALTSFYSTDNANPSPVHTLAARAAERLSAARQTVAKFINATGSNEVIFVRGTTEGMNLIASTWGAANLRAGDEVVLTVAEHNSSLMPWTRAARQAQAKVRILDVDDEGPFRIDQFKTLLCRSGLGWWHSATSRTSWGSSILPGSCARWRVRLAPAASSMAPKRRRTSRSMSRISGVTFCFWSFSGAPPRFLVPIGDA